MKLISKVLAQGVDALASPTIPFVPPGGPTVVATITVAPTPSGPSISVSTDTKTAGLNQQFTVEIKINTDGQEVSGYQFLVRFPTNLLKIVDSDLTTPDKDIELLDNFFLPTDQVIDESGINGTVYLNAASNSGTTTISGAVVARIKFETVAEGFANIAVVKENSALISLNSVDILKATNFVDLTISTSAQLPTPTSSTTIFPSETPHTALNDRSGQISVLAGAILIGFGLFIIKRINHAKVRR
ncbi:MAG: cohesin domain-containing protein [bacterium]